MFVMTAKLSKPKILAVGVLLVAVIALIVSLLTGEKVPVSELPVGSTDAERAAYLASYGWSINAQPKESLKVKIPATEDNKVFARYNDLQLSQGFDLREYAGKEVDRYVYEILNYPEAKAPVYVGVLVHEGLIIGGEITDTAPEGVMHGFRKPGQEPVQESTTATEGAGSHTESTLSTENPVPTESSATTENTEPTESTLPTEGNEPS